jgi:hypothetical protein
MLMNQEMPLSQPRKVVTAQEFRLLDTAGRTRATLAVNAKSEPCLIFYEEDTTNPRMALILDQDDIASLEMWDKDSEGGISFHVQADGELHMAFWHKDETKPRIGLQVRKDGGQFVIMHDASGEVIWREPKLDKTNKA